MREKSPRAESPVFTGLSSAPRVVRTSRKYRAPKPGSAVAIQEKRVAREKRKRKRNRNKQVLKKEKVMKKVLGTALVAAILVAALPTTASASGVTGSKGCVGFSWLRPCRAPMPPSSSGTGRGGSLSNGANNRHGGTGSTGTSQGSGTKGTLPPAPISGR
jgi:hypothetical protein